MELIQENQNLKNKIENNTYIIELKNKIEEKKNKYEQEISK